MELTIIEERDLHLLRLRLRRHRAARRRRTIAHTKANACVLGKSLVQEPHGREALSRSP